MGGRGRYLTLHPLHLRRLRDADKLDRPVLATAVRRPPLATGPRLIKPWCPRLKAPAGPYAALTTGCRECLNEVPLFESAVTLGGYREQAGPTD